MRVEFLVENGENEALEFMQSVDDDNFRFVNACNHNDEFLIDNTFCDRVFVGKSVPMLIGVPIKTPPPSVIEPTFYYGDSSLILKNKVDPDNVVAILGRNQISDDAVDDEVVSERLLAELDRWSSTDIIIVSHSIPPKCDDPNDLGPSGQGIVRLLAPVFKERSHTSADNRDSREDEVYVSGSRNASVSGKFKGAIQNEKLREVEGFLEEKGVFV